MATPLYTLDIFSYLTGQHDSIAHGIGIPRGLLSATMSPLGPARGPYVLWFWVYVAGWREPPAWRREAHYTRATIVAKRLPLWRCYSVLVRTTV